MKTLLVSFHTASLASLGFARTLALAVLDSGQPLVHDLSPENP